MLTRRSSGGVLAASSQTPTAPPANRKAAHGKSVKVPRPGIGRMYHSIGSGSGVNSGDARMIGVSIAMTTVPAISHAACSWRSRPRLQRTAAASIDRPMTLRMSTLRRAWAGPPPLINQDCNRNRKASPKICRLLRVAREAVSLAVVPRRSLEPAASAIESPARNRNPGAAKPPTIIAQP